MAESFKLGIPKKGKTFRYSALTSRDNLVKGTIRAADEAEAGHRIANMRLRMVSLEIVESKLNLEELFPTFFGVKPQEVHSFSRQLATLIEAGIPLLDGLDMLRKQVDSRGFKRVIGKLADDLRSGISLSEALAKHPKLFNEIYCKTVAAAEQTGGLHNILRQLADYFEMSNRTKKKVTGALTYPTIVICLGFLVGIILLTTALPALMEMFVIMKVELPLPTRILIALSDFLTNYKLFLLIFVALLAGGIAWVVKQPGGRLWLDGVMLRLPVIGPPMLSSEIARLCRTISVLLSAGLPLQEVMELVPQTTGNKAIRRSLIKVNQSLIRGEGIYNPMSKDDIFPPLMLQMVAVGEASNTLPSTLSVAANFYESESNEKVDHLVGVITPASTIFIALFVGFLALAVIMPMYSITGAVS